MERNDGSDEDTLLQNSLLFTTIRKNKTPEEKIQKISKYLGLGADINAVDANNKHNTPLHVAVLKGELEIVRFLLERGANATCKNNNNQTAFDIAQQPEILKGSEIASILKPYVEIQSESQKKSKLLKLANITGQINQFQAQKYAKDESKSTEEYYYQKRGGTSGLGGQLYETKLLTLVLLRALYSNQIDEFFLGTNIEGVGAFDDIIFRYNMKGNKKSKIIFLQAKHRENPTKDEITVEEVLKQNGDFSLDKYLESYLKIIRKFSPDSKDNLFRGSMEDVNCDLIIFTPGLENFTKKFMVQSYEQDFLKTNANGKIFQFEYDDKDIELLMQSISRTRAVALAKRLCQFILKDNNNYKNMMMDDLIKSFHVFLAHNLLTLETTIQDMSKDKYLIGKFRETFLKSDDDLLKLMKRTISKEIADTTKASDKHNNINIQSLNFKLPINFGNINFSFSGSELKKQRRLTYLCSKFQKLVKNGNKMNSEYILIKVDESMIGPNKILQDTDVETYRLGGLVGNLLIFDDETKHLMFNLEQHNLSEDNVKLLELLKENLNDLSQLRFDFKTSRLPRLTLVDDDSDRNIVREFLGKLKFYTNQAKEDEVENIIKTEIDKFCNIKHTQNETLFRIKCDAIFLKVHDKIQKWWKRSLRAPYLTATCKFYHEAQKDILDSPLLSVLNIIYREKINHILAKFVPNTIDSLQIENFLSRNERTLVIFSSQIHFSCIKLIQYFDENKVEQDCIFMDLDFVIMENYFENVQSELKKSKVEVLIAIFQNGSSMTNISEKICVLLHSFKGKHIIVTNSNLKDNLEPVLNEHNIIQKVDKENSLNDLAGEYREMILIKRKVVFQGNKLLLNTLLDNESVQLVKANVLCKIINNEIIEIGKTLVNPSYETISFFYITLGMSRCITIDAKKYVYDDLFVLDHVKSDHLPVPQGIADIILVSASKQDYESICNQYNERNVHWFEREGNRYVWKQSLGSLKVLFRYVSRESHNDNIMRPNILKDINDKIVIISAEPGMGKSMLLTHLAIETKRVYPKLWIANINLLEHIDQFSKWKEDETNITNMVEAIKFVYSAININFEKENEVEIPNMKADCENLVNQIYIDSENNICLLNNNFRKELCELGLLEINLFSYYYNKNLVALLFDGFDEICPDYVNEVIKLLSTLKNSKVAHLWVTTRPCNDLCQLECALGTFSFALQAFTPLEQEIFLERIWSFKLGLSDAVTTRKGVKTFLKVIKIVLRDDEITFAGIPLHLNMVSEIFKDFFRYYCDPSVDNYSNEYIEHVLKSFNLMSLYETFVDMKFFKIRFGEKKHFLCFKDPDMRKVIDKERKAFLDSHKKISAYFLLAKTIVRELFTKQEIKEVHKFIESIKSGEEKSGIIERIVGEDPKFVHITFAEYFATEYVFDKFKSETCTSDLQRYVVEQIFLKGNGGVRRFITSKILKDKKLFDLVHNKTHICAIFKTLLAQNYLPVSSFFVASEEYLDHIAMYMLICASTASTMKTVTKYMELFTRKCYGYCKLCAVKSRKLKIAPLMSLVLGTRR